jgi:hypothetical protein
MTHTIKLSDEEEKFLQSILEQKFKTNGVVPAIDKVLQKFIKNKIAELKRETKPYVYAEKIRSRWNSLPDKVKQQVIKAVDTVEEAPENPVQEVP